MAMVSVQWLVATAVASNGSVGNVNGINGGAMEAGFSQSDVAYWAQTGTGLWDGQPAVEAVYGLTEGLTSRLVGRLAGAALDRVPVLPVIPGNEDDAKKRASKPPAAN